jgi:predicted Zn-dependent protease
MIWLDRNMAVILLIAAGLAAGCTAIPASEPALQPDAADLAQARRAYTELLTKFPSYDHPAVQAYVRSVGSKVAAGAPRTPVPLRFEVLDSPGAFAYSFADGQVVISRGLLVYLNSEAQLAAVLAHEIGHVVSSHAIRMLREADRASALSQRLSRRLASEQGHEVLMTFSLARIRGYSREYEIEADVWTERLLASAGYDPNAAIQILRFFVQQEAFWDKHGFELWEMPEPGEGRGVFATHPDSAVRLAQAIKRRGNGAEVAPRPDPAYMKAMRGVIFGLAWRDGVQRGTDYAHPARRIAFKVPPGWYLFGAGDRLVVAPRSADGMLIIEMMSDVGGKSVRRALEEISRGEALEFATTLASGGMRGETGILRPKTTSDPQSLRVAVLDVSGQRLTIVGFAFQPELWSQADAGFRAIVGSVRSLPESEARRVEPLRLYAEPVAPEHAIKTLAQSFSDHPRDRWELLNQIYPNGRTAAGQWVKTIY